MFVVDQWLRSTLDDEDSGGHSRAVFYLGQGKVELSAIPQSLTGKAEAPRFADLQALPYRSRQAIAAPVPRADGAVGARPLAVVQVTGDRDFERQLSMRQRRSSRSPAPPPAAEKRDSSSSRVSNRSSIHDAPGATTSQPDAEEVGGFAEHHSAWLGLACSVAGGLLTQADRLHRRSEMCSRMKDCLEMAVNLNKAKSIRDFEQRMKHLFGFFFDVGFVRLLYYDEGSRRLFLSAAQQKSKEPRPQSMEKGIVGSCAKARQFQNVPVMARHPHLDPVADGLNRVARPINSQGSMLVGPLSTDADQSKSGGPQFLGVVQIMDRKAQNLHQGPESSPTKQGKRKEEAKVGDFSKEEAEIFQQLLRTCAQALLRVLAIERELIEKTMPGEVCTLPGILSL